MQSCACIAEIVPLGCKRMLYGRVHAASVLHMAHMLVHCDGGLRDARIVEDVLELAMFLAAICHDFQHPGLNNDFLIQVRQAVYKLAYMTAHGTQGFVLESRKACMTVSLHVA